MTPANRLGMEATATTPQASCSQDLNWADTFELPLGSLSANLQKILADGKRPDPKSRRELVKTTVQEMVKVCKKPLKKHTDAVARGLVGRFPCLIDKSLENESVIGTGYESLAVNLKYRVENVNRTVGSKHEAEVSQENDEDQSKKRRKILYGSVNPNPTDLPDGETLESLTEKRDELIRKFGEGERSWEMDIVQDFMGKTFILQRRDIDKSKTVLDLLPIWPFLFHDSGMSIHFKNLMAVDLSFAEPAVVKLLSFMKGQNISRFVGQFNAVATHVLEDLATAEESNRDMRLSASVLLVMAFFKEESESLFIEADVSSL